MASTDKEIGQLTKADHVYGPDLFVLEQSGVAKKLLGSTLIGDLATALDGHGGISSITYTPPASGSVNGTLTIEYTGGGDPFVATITNGVGISSVTSSTSGLETTYTFHYNNGGTYSFVVVDGVGMAGITTYYAVSDDGDDVPVSWQTTMQTMTVENRYLWSYQSIELNDGTTIDTTPTVIGVYGDTGQQTYVYFKWAQQNPSSDVEISDSVGPWIGVCSSTESTAPTSYLAYRWYEYKGAKGDTGTSIVDVTYVSTEGAVDTYSVNLSDGTSTQFQVTNGSSIASITKTSESGLVDTYTVTLTNGNTTNFYVTNALSITGITRTSPTPPGPGTIDTYEITFNDGSTSYSFNVYNGINGEGSVSTVSGIPSNQSGDVPQVVLHNAAPTTSSEGYLNQIWYDTLHNQLYVLVDNTGGVYQWRGATVTVDSSLNSLSTNPVQNAVITNKVGTAALNTVAQNLSGAINEVLTDIPVGSDVTPLSDTPNGSAGTGTSWSKSDHRHPLNVATSGTPANLGTASLGTAQTYAKTDHVHNMPTAANVGAVALTGDEMTGELAVKDTLRINGIGLVDGTIPSVTEWRPNLMFRDSADNLIGRVNPVFSTTGKQGVQLLARRHVNGSLTDTILRIGCDASGDRYVELEGAGLVTAFRKALGLGTNGAFPITLGQGGSGQTGTASTNTAIAKGANTTIQQQRITYWGKVGILLLSVKATANLTGDVILGTLADGFKPLYQCPLFILDSSSNYGYVSAQGEVKLHVIGTISSGTIVNVQAVLLFA